MEKDNSNVQVLLLGGSIFILALLGLAVLVTVLCKYIGMDSRTSAILGGLSVFLAVYSEYLLFRKPYSEYAQRMLQNTFLIYLFALFGAGSIGAWLYGFRI